METQCLGDNCDVASESSLSWSGGEGHEGDDELTDWAPSQDNNSGMDQCGLNDDPREIRAGTEIYMIGKKYLKFFKRNFSKYKVGQVYRTILYSTIL